MPLFLATRDVSGRERMDDPNCDQAELENTYRQFSTLNALISQWNRIYRKNIQSRLKPNHSNSLLDIGFGGGDIPIKLAQWASEDGYDLQVTAIDPDPRALRFIKHFQHPPNVEFLECKASDLDPKSQQFDFVISNHLVHHLKIKQLSNLLETARQLSTQSVIFNDIKRSDIAYLFFRIFASPVFRSSFITEDGLTSIKRSYTYRELVQAVPEYWNVEQLFPFRLLLTYNHE